MSGARFLLLFLGDDDAGWRGWLRLVDGVIVTRGTEVAAVPSVPDEDEAERCILIVPGVDVLLHWIELPSLAPAQALAAARLMAAEVSATPAERLHVALGRGGGLRCMAVADADRVGRWIAEAQACGHDPDHLLPEPLLILPPAQGVRRWERDGIHLLRGENVAFAAEPALAALVGDQPVGIVDDDVIESGMGAAVEAMPVDLRQGVFAKQRSWRVDWALARRLAAIAGYIFAATLLIQAVLILRYGFDADRLNRETDAVARGVLPRSERIANPSAQLVERLAELRGGGLGFAPSAALVFAAVRDTANVELSQLLFDRDGSLRLTVLAPSNADIAALERRLEAQGLAVAAAAARTGGGRQMADLVVTAR